MRVLIADDDPAALLLLKSMLEDWGYEVTAARGGTEAWNALQRDDRPPLAVLDWIMPGLDGIEVCRRLRQQADGPYVYLILLTGRTRKEDIIQGMEAGADDYVGKPFDEQELKVRLRAGQRIVDLHEALRVHATRDALTGAWNRRMSLDMLEREVARARREGTSVGVIMADLDHFKRLNDTHGHAAGDAALREVARRMALAVRPYDGLGRYGGEEFLIVVPGCDAPHGPGVAERIRRSLIETPVTLTAGTVPITASLGVATARGAGLDANTLLRMADAALYRAKRQGRNRVEVADPTDGSVLPDCPRSPAVPAVP